MKELPSGTEVLKEVAAGLRELHSGLKPGCYQAISTGDTTCKVITVSDEDTFVRVKFLSRVVRSSSNEDDISPIGAE
jgi:hypothetical protein